MLDKGYFRHAAMLVTVGAIAMASTSCNTSGGTIPPVPQTSACASDPLGDSAAEPPGFTSYDITQVCATRSTPQGTSSMTTVTLTITLAQPPILAPRNAPLDTTSFDAEIGFDVDGDALADSEAFISVFGTSRLPDGNYPVFYESGPAGEATASVRGNTITFVTGIATVDGSPLGVSALVGIDPNPTDFAPKAAPLTLGQQRLPLGAAPGFGPNMSTWSAGLPAWARH
jgi:hypothetical protein